MKTFVFDADGVICTGEYFTLSLEREHGIPRERLTDFLRGPLVDCIVGRRDLKEVLAPLVVTWGWRYSVDELLRFWFEREHVVCPHALASVRTLRSRGHLCVLGTNQEKYRISYMRDAMGLEAEFDHVIPACEVGAAKPSPEFYAAVESRVGRPPFELCLIDDSERNVAGAKVRGWQTVWYRSVSDLEPLLKETL